MSLGHPFDTLFAKVVWIKPPQGLLWVTGATLGARVPEAVHVLPRRAGPRSEDGSRFPIRRRRRSEITIRRRRCGEITVALWERGGAREKREGDGEVADAESHLCGGGWVDGERSVNVK